MAREARAVWRCRAILFLAFAIVHGLLLVHDARQPFSILNGDRAPSRIYKIQALLAAGWNGLPDILAQFGSPGDFMFQGVLYAVGGFAGLRAFQIALMAVIVALTFEITRRLTGNHRFAFATGLLLVFLPGSVMNPHLLISEIYSELFLLLGAGLAYLAVRRRHLPEGTRWLFLAYVLFALAAFVRLQSALVPLLLVPLLRYYGIKWPKLGSAVLLFLLVFPGSWLVTRLALFGSFGMGPSDADFGLNLMIRARRIADLAGLQIPGNELRMPLGQFLQLSLAQPVATLRTFLTDAITLLGNPGANHLFGNYLGLFDRPPDPLKWLRLMDSEGIAGVLREMAANGPLFLACFALMSLLHLVVVIGCCSAIVAGLVRRSFPDWLAIFTLTAVANLLAAFAAGGLRWSHRSSVEPELAMLAVYGIYVLLKRRVTGEPLLPGTFDEGERAAN